MPVWRGPLPQVPVLQELVQVPSCGLGDVPQINGTSCLRCSKGVYSFWRDPRVALSSGAAEERLAELSEQVQVVQSAYMLGCHSCPPSGVCVGGAVLTPQAGYWHSSSNSTLMHECKQPAACRKGNSSAQGALQQCQVKPWHDCVPWRRCRCCL